MSSNNTALVEAAMTFMQEQITKYGLELLERYPNDLLVIDRERLVQFATSGAQVAWMAGDSHSHMVQLGIHPQENEMVTCLTNMSSRDRFYLLKFSNSGVTGKEVDRTEFAALARTPIPYTSEGTKEAFSVYRGKTRVGYVQLEMQINQANRHVDSRITPFGEATPNDLTALRMWAEKGCVRLAGTLFCSSTLTWESTVHQPLRAAA